MLDEFIQKRGKVYTNHICWKKCVCACIWFECTFNCWSLLRQVSRFIFQCHWVGYMIVSHLCDRYSCRRTTGSNPRPSMYKWMALITALPERAVESRKAGWKQLDRSNKILLNGFIKTWAKIVSFMETLPNITKYCHTSWNLSLTQQLVNITPHTAR